MIQLIYRLSGIEKVKEKRILAASIGSHYYTLIGSSYDNDQPPEKHIDSETYEVYKELSDYHIELALSRSMIYFTSIKSLKGHYDEIFPLHNESK